MKLQPIPFPDVRIDDAFWAPRRERNRTVSIPGSLDMLERAGNLRNLELAAHGAREGYSGPVFMDSDLYKALEAASYSLATDPDPALDARINGIVNLMAAAQMPDGYLNTWYQVNAPGDRWTNLRDNHELYCAGHLFEAAAAHYAATGKRTLLDVATRFADHIADLFGEGPCQREGYPGHPEIELALVKLWRATGEQRDFDLARFFVEHRGERFFAREHGTPDADYDGAYWQDDKPIRDHRTIKGHAVRAAYLLSGVVDIAAETGDAGLLAMVDRVWTNTVLRRMYVTGGIGPSAHNEGFTVDYDLPNDTAYQETCASVAMILWNHRLNLLTGDARYADVLERALYNGFLAGVSLDGDRFFYVNPLESAGKHHRSEWFGCACCPPNVTRTLAALGGYAYATSTDTLVVNLYVAGGACARVGGGSVDIRVATDYPWDGGVRIAVTPDRPRAFALRLRIPGWCRSASLEVDGARRQAEPDALGYVTVEREWRAGDTVTLVLEMPVERVAAHPRVRQDAGRSALQRGPLIYCLEQCDQAAPLDAMAIALDADIHVEPRPDLLGGIAALTGEGLVRPEREWTGSLYQATGPAQRARFRAIPYYAWDNREPGAMRLWMPLVPPPAEALGPEARARVSVSFRHESSTPEAVTRQYEPTDSSARSVDLCHFWPHQGQDEWIEYRWDSPVKLAGARVYWFDDTGMGGCRLPAEWHVEVASEGGWSPVDPSTPFPIAPDRWCEARFAETEASAVRLVLRARAGASAGVLGWRVLTADDTD